LKCRKQDIGMSLLSITQILLIMKSKIHELRKKTTSVSKKITLLAAAILVLGTTANASEVNRVSGENTKTRFSFEEPIAFTERGIEFFVFPNGEFDFNTAATNNLRSRSGIRNNTYGAPGVGNLENQGVRIEHDATGKIRRIGNVFVNYDAQNRIKRVGSVYMTYNRFALTQIGGLRIFYSRGGQIINMSGNVKGYNVNYDYQNNSGTNFGNDNSENDTPESHMYYRTKGQDKEKDKK
jgi:hypothetical protein